jgi:hypothetical protein
MTATRLSLASQCGLEVAETRDVPSRAVQPRDEAAGNRVTHARKDDRDRPCLPLVARSSLSVC